MRKTIYATKPIVYITMSMPNDGKRFVSQPIPVNASDRDYTLDKWLDYLLLPSDPENPTKRGPLYHVTLQLVQSQEPTPIKFQETSDRKVNGRRCFTVTRID